MTLHGNARDAVVMALGIAMVFACDGKSGEGIDQARADDARDGGDDKGKDDSDGNRTCS